MYEKMYVNDHLKQEMQTQLQINHGGCDRMDTGIDRCRVRHRL